MKQKLPIGISDFAKVIQEDYYYIDKSLLIKELIDSGSAALLITRPRRFGKTLNASMLRCFFERTDADTSRLFHGLEIWRQGETYTRRQGRYPVVFLTFKDVLSGDWSKCYEQLAHVIRDELLRHESSLRAGVLKRSEEDELDALIGLTASEVSFENSLKLLSRWLYRSHGEKTVILIDEYDTPIQQGYLNGYYDQVIGFMRNLLSGALKDNESLEKGVLTGILRIAKESVFSGLNNLEVCTLIRKPYSTRFGLTEEEVADLLRDYEVGTPFEEVKDWYNGYRFGLNTIYNPWSILNYCANWREGLQPYWVNTSGNEWVRQLLTESDGESKRDLEQLLRGGTIRRPIDDHVVFRDIPHSPSALWSFMLLSGYLKIVSGSWDDGLLYGELQIPNREVAYLYRAIVQGWFERSIRNERQRMMLEALTDGDIETFEAIFADFVLKTFSVFDTNGDEPEKVYHAFVLGMLVGLQDRYEVRSNRESGYGRYDVMLIPKKSGKKGVIIEFKKALRGETPEQAASAALRQIEEKRYDTEQRERGISDIVKLGIALSGKQVWMKAGAGKQGPD